MVTGFSLLALSLAFTACQGKDSDGGSGFAGESTNNTQRCDECAASSKQCDGCLFSPSYTLCGESLISTGQWSLTLGQGGLQFDAPPGLILGADYAGYDLDSYRSVDASLVLPYVWGENGNYFINGSNNPYQVIPESAQMLEDAAARGRTVLREAGYLKYSAPAWVYNGHWGTSAWVHAKWPNSGTDPRGDLVTRGWTVTVYGYRDDSISDVYRGIFDPTKRSTRRALLVPGDSDRDYRVIINVRTKASGMVYVDKQPVDLHHERVWMSRSDTDDIYHLNSVETLEPGNQLFESQFDMTMNGQSELMFEVDNQDHFQFTHFASGEWTPIPEIKSDEIGVVVDYTICSNE